MLYAFLGSTLLGALSTALLLWRKSVVEKKLVQSQAREEAAVGQAKRAVDELGARSKAYEDQLSRQRDQIDTLRKQRDQAIDSLAKSETPGAIGELLRMRNMSEASRDTKGS